MREEFPDPQHPLDPGWLRPLLGVAELLSASTRPSDRLFDPGDFMIMSRIHRGGARPHRSLREAIHAIGLWELPWLRPGLEEHRHGLPYEDRWAVMDSEFRIQQLNEGGQRDGDLRLV